MSSPGNPPLPSQAQSAPGRFITNFQTLITGFLNAAFSVNEKNLGVNGAVGINNASGATAGDFFALQAIGDTVLTAYAAGDDSGATMAALTLPSGMVVYGNFTSVTVTSGYIRAYKKS